MRLFAGTVLLLAASTGTASAQLANAVYSPEEIVVSGKQQKQSAELRFVNAVATPSRSGQLARFTEKVCPRSIGLSDEANQELTKRFRRVAAAAKIEVADEPCKPNIVILFAQDRQKALTKWRTDRPDFFSGLSPSQISTLINGSDPTPAWQLLQVKGRDGRPMARTDSDGQDFLVNQQTVPSRIASSVEIEFSASFVLFEQNKLGDRSLIQLADYAAMRTLAATKPTAGTAQRMPTILSLFGDRGEPAPLSVTEWDLGYLTALYDTGLAAKASQQQRAISKGMERAVAASQSSSDQPTH